jgi:hypothetical protein
MCSTCQVAFCGRVAVLLGIYNMFQKTRTYRRVDVEVEIEK